MATISVVIPTYNRSEVIGDAIDSVLAQSFSDFEIIVVDDGSTDDTKSRLSVYDDERIRYIYQKNSGPGAARNTGIINATSRYIAFLDADDILLNDSLLAKLYFFRKHPSVMIVFSDYYMVEERRSNLMNCKPVLLKNNFLKKCGKLIDISNETEFVLNSNFYLKYLFFKPHPIWTGTVMINRLILKDIGGFKTGLFTCEDVDFWMRAIMDRKIGFIKKPSAVYHTGTKNSLIKNGKDRFKNSTDYLINLYLCKKNMRSYKLRRKIAENFWNLGYCFFCEDNFKLASKVFIKGLRYNQFSIKLFFYFISSIMPSRFLIYLKKIKRSF